MGIGSETGLVNLSEADTKKIMLVDGNEYNLQMIIAVGFKVNNERAVQFRKWSKMAS